VSVSEATTMCQPLGSGPVGRNALNTERVATVRADGRPPLFRLRSIGDKGLETELGAPFESAAAALLDFVRRIISSVPVADGAVVKIKQDVVLAVDASAFVAFNLEKVEFFAILMRAAVADVFENGFVLDHPCGCEPRSASEGSGDLIQTQLTFPPS
jgi:hypothetical protein